MLTHVEFKSSAFPPYPDEADQINPGRYGKRLGEYLAQQLSSAGVPVEDLVPADWGWVLPVTHPEFSLWMGIGNYEEYPDGMLCFIEPSVPEIRQFPKIWKTIDTTLAVENLRLVVDSALAAHQAIHDVKWWSHEDFNAPGPRGDA